MNKQKKKTKSKSKSSASSKKKQSAKSDYEGLPFEVSESNRKIMDSASEHFDTEVKQFAELRKENVRFRCVGTERIRCYDLGGEYVVMIMITIIFLHDLADTDC